MTAAPVQLSQRDIAEAQRIVGAVGDAFSAKVVGQENLRESLLIGLLTGGHILIESVPGLAKTTAARVIAESIHGGFQRIQCTPDLLPSDIIGTQIYDSATNSFVTELGPVHTNIVLLDEINRSSAKTQSAMLEAMEERQTTIAGRVYPIPEPFLVIATQNPVDQEGTYPLSEAQTDRFLLKDVLSYPSPEEEVEVMDRMDAGLYDKDHRSQAGRRPRRRAAAAGDRSPRPHGPGTDALRQRARRRDPHSRRIPAPPARPADRVRRQPTRDHRVLQDRARAGDSVRPGARHPRRHREARPPCAAAPTDPRIRGGQHRRHPGDDHRRRPASGPGAVEAAVGKHLNRARAHFGTDTRGLLEGGRYALLHTRSLEFDDLRPYVRGDDVRDIDWKASARSGSVLIKRFVDEKHHKILLVADAGRNMTAQAPSGETKLDVAANILGAVGLITLGRADQIGMVYGDGRGCVNIRQGRGETHIESMLHRFYGHTLAKPGQSDIACQLDYVATHYRHPMLIVVVSDEPEVDARLEDVIDRLRGRHDVMWAMVSDMPAVGTPEAGARRLRRRDGQLRDRRCHTWAHGSSRPIGVPSRTAGAQLAEFMTTRAIPHTTIGGSGQIRTRLVAMTEVFARAG